MEILYLGEPQQELLILGTWGREVEQGSQAPRSQLRTMCHLERFCLAQLGKPQDSACSRAHKGLGKEQLPGTVPQLSVGILCVRQPQGSGCMASRGS